MSQVCCYFQEEKDSLRHGNNAPATSLLARLAGFVKRALGHVTPDADEHNLYHLTEGNLVVRRVVAIDGFISHALSLEEIYRKTVAEDVKRMFNDQKDILFVVAGHAGCTKGRTLHGGVRGLVTSGQAPSEWGVVRYALEDLLKSASEYSERMDDVVVNGYDIMVSAVKLQLGNISDCLVPKGSVHTVSQDKNALRNRYLRLLAIASSSRLEMEENNGSFFIPDSVELPIKNVEDVDHFTNCIALLRATTKYYGLAGRKKGSPFHVVVTVKCVPLGTRGGVRRMQFVELADMDWASNLPTDTATVRAENDHICRMLCSLQEMANRRSELESKGNSLGRTRSAHRLPERCSSTLQSRLEPSMKKTLNRDVLNLQGLQRVELLHLKRATVLSRLVFSQLDPFNCKVIFSGHSLFSKVQQIMSTIASLKNEKVRISFQGPNGEGHDEIDDELRRHVCGLQNDSESLRLMYLESLGENHRLKLSLKGKLAEYRSQSQKLQTMLKMISDESKHSHSEAVDMKQDSKDVTILRSMTAELDVKRIELSDLLKESDRDNADAVAYFAKLKQELAVLKESNVVAQAEVDRLQSESFQKHADHDALCKAIQGVASQVTERLIELTAPAVQSELTLRSIETSKPAKELPSLPTNPVEPHHAELAAMTVRSDALVNRRTIEAERAEAEASAAESTRQVNMESIKGMVEALAFIEGLTLSESAQYFALTPKTLLAEDAPNVILANTLNQCRAKQWTDYIEQEWTPGLSQVVPSPHTIQSFNAFANSNHKTITPEKSPRPVASSSATTVPIEEASVVRRRLHRDMQYALTQQEVTTKSRQRLRAMKSKKF